MNEYIAQLQWESRIRPGTCFLPLLAPSVGRLIGLIAATACSGATLGLVDLRRDGFQDTFRMMKAHANVIVSTLPRSIGAIYNRRMIPPPSLM